MFYHFPNCLFFVSLKQKLKLTCASNWIEISHSCSLNSSIFYVKIRFNLIWYPFCICTLFFKFCVVFIVCWIECNFMFCHKMCIVFVLFFFIVKIVSNLITCCNILHSYSFPHIHFIHFCGFVLNLFQAIRKLRQLF